MKGDLTSGEGVLNLSVVPDIDDARLFLMRNGIGVLRAQAALDKPLEDATVGDLLSLPTRLAVAP